MMHKGMLIGVNQRLYAGIHEIFEAKFKQKDIAACHSPLQLQHELCGEHQQQSQHFHLDKTQS
jgi:hypothetical protein